MYGIYLHCPVQTANGNGLANFVARLHDWLANFVEGLLRCLRRGEGGVEGEEEAQKERQSVRHCGSMYSAFKQV